MSHSIREFHRRPAAWLLGLALLAGLSPAAYSADKPKQELSRTLAKEANAAQKAMQAGQWSEALKNLEAAEAKPSLTPFDKKWILDSKAFCYLHMNNLKAAQASYEAAVAT